jgi:hypothetical protein
MEVFQVTKHFLSSHEKVVLHITTCLKKGRMVLQRTATNGMATDFIYKCDKCQQEMRISSMEEREREDFHTGAVWGSIAIGTGYDQLVELLAHMGIYTMSYFLYQRYEYRLLKVSTQKNFIICK